MKNEMVSVIIPTHNRSNTLERAIKSVISQTYPEIEIIIVDDNANNEEERQKVKKIVENYNNINLIQNKVNLGGGQSRNEGIKAAKGKYVAFLDDDDEFFPQKIEKQYELYKYVSSKDDKVGLIYCYAEYISENERKIRKVDLEGNPLKEHLMLCIAATSWWFCPKDVLEKLGGFEDVSSHQDAMTLFKILKAGYNIYRVPEVLLKYYVHNGSGITKTSYEWINVDKEYMKKYMEIKERFSKKDQRDIEFSFFSRAASYYYRLNDKKQLKESTIEMIKRKPFKYQTIKTIVKNFLISFKGEI